MNAITEVHVPPEQGVEELIRQALEEDIGAGDVTTNAIIDEDKRARARWIAKEEGIVAGLSIVKNVFQKLDKELEWNRVIKDGAHVKQGQELIIMKGKARAILTAERIALNIAQRMSGIASKTAQFVKAIRGTGTQILDTRKTVPGMRALDKYAVTVGGGTNHRIGLYDLAMIKDNHIVAAGGIKQAVTKVRKQYPELQIEVEAANMPQVGEALKAGADIIMLDNMQPDLMKTAVSRIEGRAKTEASGNISLETVRAAAGTGVDYISVGALTHSVQAFDISQQL